MLINCPRCGFSQPKDQYCASCGVNMETFVPRKRSIFEKLISNTVLQVILVAGVTLGVSYYALKNRADDPAHSNMRRRQQMMTPTQIPDRTATDETLQSSAALDANSQRPTEINDTGENLPVELALQNEEQRNQLIGAPSAVEPTGEAKLENQAREAMTGNSNSVALKFSFYEVDRQLFNYWIQLNQASARSDESGNVRVGLVNIEVLQQQLQSQPLKTETKKVGVSTTSFSAGASTVVNNVDQFIGLVSEVTLQEISSNRLQGSLKITRKNSQGTDSVNIPLSITAQNAFFIHWRNDLSGFDREPSLANIPPFQILSSPRYDRQQTDLVIILEPYF